jgi:hypothetical protein
LSEKAILPNEANLESTGLISNGLAGVQTDAAGSLASVMALIRVFLRAQVSNPFPIRVDHIKIELERNLSVRR